MLSQQVDNEAFQAGLYEQRLLIHLAKLILHRPENLLDPHLVSSAVRCGRVGIITRLRMPLVLGLLKNPQMLGRANRLQRLKDQCGRIIIRRCVMAFDRKQSYESC